ncbi:MAG: hypothetical protein KGH60_03080 [Candidatus Micrarchaeota archaeon]|nr:hypothetical protein [Candidatus Micrarchaeota archaeon]
MKMQMKETELERLTVLELIQNVPGVIEYHKNGTKLNSGIVSTIRFNLELVLSLSMGLDAVSEVFMAEAKPYYSMNSVNQIGGEATGAIPIISGMLSKALKYEMEISGFWVSKDGKVNGSIFEYQDYINVDDVSTTGGSFNRVSAVAARYNSLPHAAFAIIDRGAEPAYEKAGVRYKYMFTEQEALQGTEYEHLLRRI